MAEYTMQVVTSPNPNKPLCWATDSGFGGRGYPDVYLCGKCGIIVARDLPVNLLQWALIRCPNCGACNAAEAAREAQP